MKEQPIAPHSPRAIPWILELGNKLFLTKPRARTAKLSRTIPFLTQIDPPLPLPLLPQVCDPGLSVSLVARAYSSHSRTILSTPTYDLVALPLDLHPLLLAIHPDQFTWYSCRALNAMFLAASAGDFFLLSRARYLKKHAASALILGVHRR